jgi:peptidoglycan/xylan/chitin deacetylase (PgdA/CDA1 family)
MSPVPVLMYHHVNPHAGDLVTVTPRVFEEQMRHLRSRGYHSLPLEALMGYLEGETVPPRSVVITFDDGWLDNYLHAFPVLRRYGIRAAIFLVTERVGEASRGRREEGAPVPTHRESKMLMRGGEAQQVALNWDHVREMAEGGLVEFHSHTKTHAKCDTLSAGELEEELGESKEEIEERTGRPCSFVCWPHGRGSDAAIETARSLGYRGAFTTKAGIAAPGADPFDIPRIVVKDDVGWFRRRVAVYTSAPLSKLYLKVKRA